MKGIRSDGYTCSCLKLGPLRVSAGWAASCGHAAVLCRRERAFWKPVHFTCALEILEQCLVFEPACVMDVICVVWVFFKQK